LSIGGRKSSRKNAIDMGLDVTLCRFRDLDTEAILKFSAASRQPWSFEAGAGARLKARAHELGLPESILPAPYLGGTPVTFPSKKHPNWQVGEWASFGITRELIAHFTGKSIYFVFPEAEGDPSFLRPDWVSSKERLVDILQEVQILNSDQIEYFHALFLRPHVPAHLLARVKPEQLATPSEIFARQMEQIDVMIETLEYVLNHDSPREFLLRWSA